MFIGSSIAIKRLIAVITLGSRLPKLSDSLHSNLFFKKIKFFVFQSLRLIAGVLGLVVTQPPQDVCRGWNAVGIV